MEGPQQRQYTVEMMVEPGSSVVGKTIEEAGLRQLPGLFLSEIDRGGDVLPAVGPEERILSGDRLVFVGVIESVVDLLKTRGLVPATDQVGKVEADRRARTIVEAVVSGNSPLVRRSVRMRRPVVDANPESDAAIYITRVARTLMASARRTRQGRP